MLKATIVLYIQIKTSMNHVTQKLHVLGHSRQNS